MMPNIASSSKSGKNDAIALHQVSPASLFIFIVITLLVVIAAAVMDYYHVSDTVVAAVSIPVLLLALYILFAFKMAKK